MKKVLPLLIIGLVAVALWFAISSRSPSPTQQLQGAPNSTSQNRASLQTGMINEIKSGAAQQVDGISNGTDEDEGEGIVVDERPATELYKSADEALKAVRDGAVNYDDLVLDQFTELGENCSWCDSFYSTIKDLLFSPDTKPDQRSYFAEVLAVSGRVENVKSLAEAIKNAKTQEEGDVYAEALELAVGKNDVVKYLSDQLHDTNESLREASIAAITNQGSRLAVESLYAYTSEKGDPDGFYSMGIGLGELVPDQEAMPFLQELVSKRDQYSHLAVKALLNSGLDGVKVVVDVLSNSSNQGFDKEMLKGAADHVSYDDEVMNYLKQVADSSNNPVAAEFAKQVLADFSQSEAQDEANEGVQP